jgi:hypothetical protein
MEEGRGNISVMREEGGVDTELVGLTPNFSVTSPLPPPLRFTASETGMNTYIYPVNIELTLLVGTF